MSEREQSFLSAYLMVGTDAMKRDFVLARLEKRFAAMGDLDFNRDVFVGEAATADEIIAALETLPFMSDYRLVIVKDADKLAKAVQDALVEYLGNPSPAAVLALTAEKLAKNTRLYKAVAKIDKKAVIDCAPRSKRELPAQVRDFAAAKGLTMSQAAAEMLIAYVGESTVRLDTELTKISAALGRGAAVEVGHVERLVVRTAEVKPWEIVDALAARDARRVATLYARMQDRSPYGLLTMCVKRIRELLVAKDLQATGRTAELAAELKVPDWRVKNHFRWARAFKPGELEHALTSAAELDCKLKSGGDKERLFEAWALGVCTGA